MKNKYLFSLWILLGLLYATANIQAQHKSIIKQYSLRYYSMNNSVFIFIKKILNLLLLKKDNLYLSKIQDNKLYIN